MGCALVILCSMFIFIHSSAGLQCYSCAYLNITDPPTVPNDFALRAVSHDACQPGKTPPREFIKPCESTDSNNVVGCVTITVAYSTYAVLHLRSCLKVPNINVDASNNNPSSNQCRQFSQAELLQTGVSLEHVEKITEATICGCEKDCTSVDEAVSQATATMQQTTKSLLTGHSSAPGNQKGTQKNLGLKPVVSFLLLVFLASITVTM